MIYGTFYLLEMASLSFSRLALSTEKKNYVSINGI